ncbi:uncharacterized protein PG998_006294 [Apiospora kogelbergensis]|uniref:uncharacterized protein n=1 Tax=Apiospora kogelbergensis TaxID=1337665 RepID=UPI00312D864A
MDPSQISNYPAMAPPAGVTPNFVDPFSLAPSARITIYVTLPLMVIVLALRLYVRIRITHAMGADDFFGGVYLGPHQWNVRLIDLTPDYINGAIIVTCLYSACAMLIKISLLLLCLRIFRQATGANIMVWMGIVVIALFYLICITTTAIFCDPRQWPKQYSSPLVFLQAQETSRCNHPQLNLSAVQGVFSTLSDIYVLAVPVIFISGLKMSMGRKVSVCGVFLVGVVESISRLTLVPWLKRHWLFIGHISFPISATKLLRLFVVFGMEYFTWLSITSAAELNTGVICACVPVAFVLFKSAIQRPWDSLRSYMHGLWSRSRSGRRQGDSSPGRQHQQQLLSDTSQFGLPKIPRGVITGLRTFVQGGSGRGRGRSTHDGLPGDSAYVQTEMTMYSTYEEIEPVEVEYHRQLRGSESRGRGEHPTSSPFRKGSANRV